MRRKVIKQISLLLALVFVFLFTLTGCDMPWDKDDTPAEPTIWTIQYTDDEGTHQLKVEDGMPFSIESIPEREGYDFLGLFDAEVGGTQYVSASGASLSTYTDKRNMVLFPQFRAKKYTLQLNYGKAPDAGIDRVEVSYDGEIQGLPEDFYVDGSEFLGWYNTQDATGTKFTNGAVMNKTLAALADENDRIALHAIFNMAKYTVRFYSYDGNTLLAEKQVTHGTDISEAAPKTLSDGTEILGWSTSKEHYDDYKGAITESGTFYVKYYSCTLTLNHADGKEETVKVKNGESYTLKQLSRTGYDFLGWDDGSGNLRTGSITPTANMTLTAKWRAISYTVSFSVTAGEGTVSQGSKSVTFGSSFSFPVPTSSRSDYEFDGWYSDTGKKLTDMGGNSLTEWNIPNDTTVTARFVRIEYTITFSTGGGTSIGARTVYKGDSIDLPTCSKRGYSFDYWETSSGTRVYSPYKPTGDITLYAHWTANSYTIRLDPQGGSGASSSVKVTYGASYKLPIPSKTGFTFNGWYLSVSRKATKLTDATGASIEDYDRDEDITAYAVWVSDVTASLSRVSCADTKDYDPNSPGSDRDAKTHAAFELIQAVLGGVSVTSSDVYFVPQGSILSLSLKVLEDIDSLPKSGAIGANWYTNKINEDTCTTVYGTGISGKIGKGAYSIVIAYSDGTTTETTATNILNGISKGGTISIPLTINAAKTIASIKVTVVYEIIYSWYDGWWHDAYSNWRCEKVFDFEQ